jgi:hypothetical protein
MNTSRLTAFALVAIVLVLIAACASQVASLPNEKPLSDREIAARQAVLAGAGRTMEPTSSERFDIVVVGGSCAPKVTAKFAVSACVAEKPCNGHGLRIASGEVVCACYEVRGGCDGGSFCNRRTRTCSKLPQDTYHAQ